MDSFDDLEEVDFDTLEIEEQHKVQDIVRRFLADKRVNKKKKTQYDVQSIICQKAGINININDCRKLRLQAKKIKNFERQKRKIKKDVDDKLTQNALLRHWDDKIAHIKSNLGYSRIIKSAMRLEDVKKHVQRQEELNSIKVLLANRIVAINALLVGGENVNTATERTLRAQISLIKGYMDVIQTELANNASMYQTLSYLMSARMIDTNGEVIHHQHAQRAQMQDASCFDIMSDIFVHEDDMCLKDAETGSQEKK